MDKYQCVKNNWAKINTQLRKSKKDFAAYLKYSAVMYKQPYSDSVLVYQQNPKATKIATFKRWKRLNRYVRRDSSGIAVFGPNHTCRYMFDVTQTAGKELPELWSLNNDNTPELLAEMNKRYSRQSSDIQDCISFLCADSLQKRMPEVRKAISEMKLSKEESKTYQRTLLSAVRYVVSQRCDLNGEMGFHAKLNLNAIDLINSNNDFISLCHLIQRASKDTLSEIEKDVIAINKRKSAKLKKPTEDLQDKVDNILLDLFNKHYSDEQILSLKNAIVAAARNNVFDLSPWINVRYNADELKRLSDLITDYYDQPLVERIIDSNGTRAALQSYVDELNGRLELSDLLVNHDYTPAQQSVISEGYFKGISKVIIEQVDERMTAKEIQTLFDIYDQAVNGQTDPHTIQEYLDNVMLQHNIIQEELSQDIINFDKFKYNKDSDSLTWIYFNPDGNYGKGQLVESVFYVDDIVSAYSSSSTDKDFIDVLYHTGNTTLTDVGTDNFSEAFEYFKSDNFDFVVKNTDISKITNIFKGMIGSENIQKIMKNSTEDKAFCEQIDSFVDGKMPINKTIVIGETPNILYLLGATADSLTINQNVLRNSMMSSDEHTNGHTEGHEITVDIIKQLPKALRDPVIVLQGQHDKTVVTVTSLINTQDKNIIVPIALDLRGAESTVNKVTSIYGKNNIRNYIADHQDKIIAVNTKKANELFTTIGYQLSQTTSAICFDDSIAYTLENVKTPDTENNILSKTAEQSPKEQAAVKAWHELGDAYVEAYEKMTYLDVNGSSGNVKNIMITGAIEPDDSEPWTTYYITDINDCEPKQKKYSELTTENMMSLLGLSEEYQILKNADGELILSADYGPNMQVYCSVYSTSGSMHGSVLSEKDYETFLSASVGSACPYGVMVGDLYYSDGSRITNVSNYNVYVRDLIANHPAVAAAGKTQEVGANAHTVDEALEIIKDDVIRQLNIKNNTNTAKQRENISTEYDAAPLFDEDDYNELGTVEQFLRRNVTSGYATDTLYYYHIDFCGTLVLMLAVAICLIFAGIKIATTLFEIMFSQLITPFIIATDLNNSGRSKKAIQNMLLSNIILMIVVILIRVYLAVIWGVKDSKYGDNFAVMLMLIIAGAKFVIDGPEILTKLFGIDAGVKSGAATIMAINQSMQMGGYALTGLTRVGSGAVHGATSIVKHTANGAAGAASGFAKGIAGGIYGGVHGGTTAPGKVGKAVGGAVTGAVVGAAGGLFGRSNAGAKTAYATTNPGTIKEKVSDKASDIKENISSGFKEMTGSSSAVNDSSTVNNSSAERASNTVNNASAHDGSGQGKGFSGGAVKGADGRNGLNGTNGLNGANGNQGAPGKDGISKESNSNQQPGNAPNTPQNTAQTHGNGFDNTVNAKVHNPAEQAENTVGKSGNSISPQSNPAGTHSPETVTSNSSGNGFSEPLKADNNNSNTDSSKGNGFKEK